MSYIPPSPVAFDFTTGSYSAPAGNAVEFDISGPVSFTGSAVQGFVDYSGLNPSLSSGFQAASGIRQIDITGLTPGSYFGHFTAQAVQYTIALAELLPGLSTGFSGNASIEQIDLIGLDPNASFYVRFQDTANQGIVDFSGLTPSVLSTGYAAAPAQLQITLTGLTPSPYFGHFIGNPVQGFVDFSGLTTSVLATGFAIAPTQAYLDWIGQLPTLITRNVNDPPLGWTAVRYRCFLTPPDSTVFDIELPISSFQSRLRLEGTSYLSVVLKGADAYADQIIEADNRKMMIFREYHYLDGYINSQVIAATDYETLQISEGGKSGVTATLSGNGDFVPSDAATIALKNPTYRSVASGKKRYRCEIDARLRPGDTAQINGDSFIVDEIVYVIDTKSSIMEISG